MMNATVEPSPLDGNYTCSDPAAGPTLLGASISLVSLVTIMGNLLTIAAFVADRSLGNKPSEYLILSLSCADLLIGAAIPVRVGEAICSFWPFGEIGCELQVFFNDVGVVSGLACMTAIAQDRYLLISRDYPSYLERQSMRNVCRTIALIWMTAVSSALVEIIAWEVVDWEMVDGASFAFDRECLSPPRNNAIFALTIFVMVFLIPIVGVVGMSLRFLVLLRRRLRDFKKPTDRRKGSVALSSTLTPPDSRNAASSAQTKESDLSNHQSGSSDPLSNRENGDENMDDPPSGPSKKPWLSRLRPMSRNGKYATRDRYLRPAIIMGSLVVTFLACSLPYLIFVSVVVQLCPECYFGMTQFHLVNILFLNSCINPFLYAATHPKIRRFHMHLYKSIGNKLLCLK